MRNWRTARRHPELWLVAFALVVFGPFVQALTAQPASRYALTAAVADRHTVDLHGLPLGVDRVTLANGHLRSDKAPGQPLLAVPVYVAGRALGFQPAAHRRIDGNLGLWWITFWSAMVPVALLLVLMRRVARSLDAPAATIAPIAIVFAGLIAAFATLLFGSILAGLFGFAAWYVLRAAPRDRVLLWFGGGLLVGSAIITDYTMVLVAVVLTVFVVARAPRRLGWFLAGGVPPAIVGAVYNQLAFGSPWKVGYADKGAQPGFLGIAPPKLDSLVRIFVADRGLLLIAPVTIVAIIAAIRLVRGQGPRRTEALVALVIFGLFLMLQAGWPNPWGGTMPGPRYMIPAFPFLAAPLAVEWPRLRRAAIAATAWGMACMTCAVIIFSLVPDNQWLFVYWRDAIASHTFVPTVWTIAFGPAGWILHLATIVVCAVGLHRAVATPAVDPPEPATQPRAALV